MLPDWLKSVFHSGAPRYVSNLQPRLGDEVLLRVRVGSDAPVCRIILRTFPDGEQAFAPLQKADAQPPIQWWQIAIPIREPVVHYRFIIEADDGAWWYTAKGPSLQNPLDAFDFRILADYAAPTWVHQSVFYQIFPDRFANGDPSLGVKTGQFGYADSHPIEYGWDEAASAEHNDALLFFNGDLAGIEQNLDYIAGLGVNAIYLNPIFSAFSNHKYDVTDYDNVDVNLGGNRALVGLSEQLRQREMHYLLDIVPNHCGYRHPWFASAQADANAPEAEFFTFREHPDAYESWLGVGSLPKLNYQSERLREIIYNGQDSVFRKWLKPPFSADGWRVDVANMLGRQGALQIGHAIGREIRAAVKQTNPDSYLLGENFFDSTPQLQGDQFDGMMNYAGFAHPVHYWLAGFNLRAWGFRGEIVSPTQWSTEAMAQTWVERMAVVPWVIALQQFNLLGSHDIGRISTRLNHNAKLHQLAFVLQMTFPGVPSLYYGDEVGMVDLPGVRARGTMRWNPSEWNADLLGLNKRLVALRRSSEALATGSFQLLAVENDSVIYQREGISERVLVVAARHPNGRPAGEVAIDHAGLANGTQLREIFSGQTATVEDGFLTLPAQEQGGTIWVARNGFLQ